MKIKEFLKFKDGAYILEKILKKDKSWLILNDNLNAPDEAVEILKKVSNGYPIEYIFKEAYFFQDRFFVKEGVLIPRDDTEVVVERAIKVINKKCKVKNECLVVDCCTGSGVIAIEVAKHTNAKVIATDISDVALSVARENIKMHNLEKKIKLKKCNLLDCLSVTKLQNFKRILVANPPYVENSWKKPNNFEPDIAFYGGEDGLSIVKKLIIQAKDLGFDAAIVEIGFNQKEKLEKFLRKKGEFKFFKDLAGNYRGFEILF